MLAWCRQSKLHQVVLLSFRRRNGQSAEPTVAAADPTWEGSSCQQVLELIEQLAAEHLRALLDLDEHDGSSSNHGGSSLRPLLIRSPRAKKAKTLAENEVKVDAQTLEGAFATAAEHSAGEGFCFGFS